MPACVRCDHLHIDCRCAEACNNLGVLYKDLEAMELAMQSYRLALTMRPNFPEVRAPAQLCCMLLALDHS